jgi:hypothetical protein
VIEPKYAFNPLTEEKSLWCIHCLLWGLCIQLMTLGESDSIIRCLWWRRQLEAERSIVLTTTLNSTKLESKIPTGTEKTPRRWPWWFRKTPPIPEGPGLPREEPSTFHLKLLTIRGDHVLTILVDWTLDHRIRPSADLSRSDGEYGKSEWIAFSHRHRRVIIRKKIVS